MSDAKVALDLEGVLADTKSVFLERYNDKTEGRTKKSDIDGWDWVGDTVDLDMFNYMVDSIWINSWRSVPPESGDVSDHLKSFSSVYNIDVVTARTGVEDKMRLWLKEMNYAPYIDSLISVDPTKGKAPLGYKYYVDDNPHLARSLGDSQAQLLVSQPWNRNTTAGGKVKRVPDVQSAMEMLQQ